MGPTRVLRSLRRIRGTTAVTLVLLALAAAVTLHHASAGHHGERHDMSSSAAVGYCVAVFAAVGSAVVAIVLGLLPLGRRHPVTLIPIAVVMATRPAVPGARAGPDHLRLCVLLR